MEPRKPVHTIILDAAPLLNNDPTISTLLSKSESLFTTPAVISEIKDKQARARLEVAIIPFLTIRTPNPASIKFVSDFARKTGDLWVLSKPDIQVLALAYELECERNHGDWRLRKAPGQKGLNGSPPNAKKDGDSAVSCAGDQQSHIGGLQDTFQLPEPCVAASQHTNSISTTEEMLETGLLRNGQSQSIDSATAALSLDPSLKKPCSNTETKPEADSVDLQNLTFQDQHDLDSTSSDSEGWITPGNLRKQHAKDQDKGSEKISESSLMQVATITGDFAMQNVLLQMNLNLLSTSFLRIRHLKTYILRCHACFEKTKDMTKQFCPRCGKPTLTRVSCSTSANGEFKLHLKKNMQWNTRGDRFSIPKPVAGTANGKLGASKGGGKGGWGQELILAEDQKEYLRAMTTQNRKKERNLMDEDYLPGILTGERRKVGGRPKVGAGRNVNSKKR